MQVPAKTESSWSRINKVPIELLRKARSWLGRRLSPLRNKPSKPLKPWKSLKPLPPVASMSVDNDAHIQCRIEPIESDILETHAVVDPLAGDEDAEAFIRIICEACSILVPVAESQGRRVDNLTGEEVQQAVVEAYYLCTAPRDHGKGRARTRRPAGGTSSSSTFSQASTTVPAGSKNQGQGLKRVRSEDSGDRDGEWDGDGEDSGRKRRSSRDLSQKGVWLCPFYPSDQEAHRQCLRLKLSRIVDVRSHILRRHLQQSHCPRCGHQFPNDPTGTNRNNHILACEAPQSAFHYPGATPEQWEHILAGGRNRANSRAHGNRGRATHTDEDEWFHIWDILFPRTARPPSPYVHHSDVVQFMLDSSSRFMEQGPAEEIVNSLLPEDTSPELYVQLLQNIRLVVDSFVNFVHQREISSRAASNSQTRSHVIDAPEPQIPPYSPLSQSQRSQQVPRLAVSSLAGYADGNTLNEPGPAVAPELLKLPDSDQSMFSAVQEAWPTIPFTGSHRGLTVLQVNPHESGDVNTGPADELADLTDEDSTPGAILNPR